MLDPPRKHFEVPSVIKTGSSLAPHLGVKRDAQINREKNVSKPFMVWCVCVRDIYPQYSKCVYVCVCSVLEVLCTQFPYVCVYVFVCVLNYRASVCMVLV